MNRRAIGSIRFLSTVIMVIAAVVSYETQRQLLLGWKVDQLSAVAIPITVDLLAIICTLGAHLDGVSPAGRRIAYRVLAIAGTASITANFTAGITWGSRIAHGWTVLAYLLAELVAAKVKADVAPTATVAATGSTLAVQPENLADPVAAVLALPSIAPVSPAPAGRPIWAPELVQARPLPPSRRAVRQIRVLSKEGSAS